MKPSYMSASCSQLVAGGGIVLLAQPRAPCYFSWGACVATRGFNSEACDAWSKTPAIQIGEN
jgi:hypothetical protein